MSRTSRFHPNRLLAVGLLLAAAGCGNSDGILGVNDGRVRFVLSADSDAPAPGTEIGPATSAPSLHGDEERHDNPHFQSANVTFSSILARNLDGVLLNVVMDLPVTLDVVIMESGREIPLPDGGLDPGTYDQLVVVMTQVEGVTHDGTTITITPPGGGWTAIVERCPFVVGEGETTVVGLRFMVRQAFFWGEGRFHFRPRLRCPAPEPEPDPVTD
jgi:hypothetical protein